MILGKWAILGRFENGVKLSICSKNFFFLIQHNKRDQKLHET